MCNCFNLISFQCLVANIRHNTKRRDFFGRIIFRYNSSVSTKLQRTSHAGLQNSCIFKASLPLGSVQFELFLTAKKNRQILSFRNKTDIQYSSILKDEKAWLPRHPARSAIARTSIYVKYIPSNRQTNNADT